MQSHRQNVLGATVNPFNVIGTVLSARLWAYAKPSAEFVGCNLDPFNIIGISLCE
jgi:hypothetical protein